VENLTVTYDNAGIEALSNLSFWIKPGEYVASVGPNGSGKSTLVKAICGLIGFQVGRIFVQGKNIAPGRFAKDLFGKIGVVLQEPEGQFLMRDVRHEISNVLQNLGLHSGEQDDRFRKIVQLFDLINILDLKTDRVSGGQMQIVNLACALASDPLILILDEPTTFIDLRYREIILAHLIRFVDSGRTVVHVTQFPDEALVAGRLLILNNGRLVHDCKPREALGDKRLLEENRLVQPYQLTFEKLFGFPVSEKGKWGLTRESLSAIPESRQLSLKINPCPPRPGISIRDLKFSYKDSAFRIDIENLDLGKGEIVGIVGPSGCGKTTLALLIAGLYRPESGSIFIDDMPLGESATSELRRKIALVWQLPELTFIGPTVKDDLEFDNQSSGAPGVSTSDVLEKVGLGGFENRIVDTLSGGEKRKLSIASALVSMPHYVIFDEPEAFLDPFSENELVGLIRNLSDEGIGILIAGHDLHFIAELAKRVVGMRDGRIVFDLAAADFFSDETYVRKMGMPSEPMISFRHFLREAGVSLPFASLNPERIAAFLNLI
jgi:energy-coupling factor transport system ATP-binding protein